MDWCSHPLDDSGATVLPMNDEVLLTIRFLRRVRSDVEYNLCSSVHDCRGGEQFDNWPELTHDNDDYSAQLRTARNRKLPGLLGVE